MFPAADPTIRMPPEPRLTICGSTARVRSWTAFADLLLDLGDRAGRGGGTVGVEVGDRSEGRDARVVAEDRDVAAGELGGEHFHLRRVRQVDRADLDRDLVCRAEFAGEFLEKVAPAGDEDDRMTPGGQRACEFPSDSGRGPGDDGTGGGGKRRYRHVAMVAAASRAETERQSMPAATSVPCRIARLASSSPA